MGAERVFFTGGAGGSLSGAFHLPAERGPAVVMCHGFLSSKGSHFSLAEMLAKAGFAALRFDFSGCGESGGALEDMTVSGLVSDLEGALDYAKSEKRIDPDRIFAYGSSLGGMVALLGAAKRSDIRGLILRAPLSDFSGVWKDIAGGRLEEWERKGFLDMELFGISFRLKYGFYRDAEAVDMYKAIEGIRIPSVIFHGDADNVVPVEQSRKLASILKNCRLFVMDGAGHRFNRTQEKGMAEKMAGFMEGIP